MKKVKLHIKELGPIKNSVVELAPLMVFTGASGLGKSYVNFLSYYVYDQFANKQLLDFLGSKVKGKEWKNGKLSFSFSMSSLGTYLAKYATPFMRELLNHPKLVCDVSFEFGDDMPKDIKVVAVQNDPQETCLTIYANGSMIARYWGGGGEFALQKVCESVGDHLSNLILGFDGFAFILPPGRTSLMDNSFSVLQAVANSPLYNRYLHDYDMVANKRSVKSDAMNPIYTELMGKILNGEIVKDKDGIRLVTADGKEIPISAAASSVREVAPLLFAVKNGWVGGNSFCLEEPEAHAHPDMQYEIANLMAACLNDGALFQMTTHSDFLLSRLNQLIRLFTFRAQNQEAFEASEFASESPYLLDPDMVSAYYFARKEDGSVAVKQLDMTDGIPFDSFDSAVRRQLLFTKKFNQLNKHDD